MENDTAHDLSEFAQFPWHLLADAINWRDDDVESDWQVGGVSRGGVTAGMDFNPRGGKGYRPHIDFLRPDASVDAWEVPEALYVLVEMYREMGRSQKRDEIRSTVEAALSEVAPQVVEGFRDAFFNSPVIQDATDATT